MKIRKLLITLLILVLLIVYYFVGTSYMKQRQDHETLISQTNEATRSLAQIPKPPDDLQRQLAAARASLDIAIGSFPSQMNSTRIVDAILKLADDEQVKAIPLITQPWTTEKVGYHNYAVFRLNVAVTGTFTQMESFLSKLENGEPETLIVEDLKITRVTESSGESAAEVTLPVNASLDIAIYTQPPTPD